ncbi:MAG: L,D-transpeptidase family protein [Xanthobacteraceae bacterium]
MHRLAFPTLLTVLFTAGHAFAAPLNLSPQPSSNAVGATAPQAYAAQPSAAPPPRYASTNLGGGLLEMLFGGPGQQSSPQPYMYEPSPGPQTAPVAPGYRQPQSDELAPGYREHASVHPSRPAPDSRFDRQVVNYNGKEPAGTVIINTRERMLYLVQGNGRALRYGIGVGRPGFTWAGTHRISSKREWPDWRPPKEMLRRQPNLPRYMSGGPDNPLGARAMYLGSTLYRIHGSNEPWTIGQAVSSGCIRMRNEDVVHLYNQVKVGTKVVVI